jgi:hypothetical protein
MDEFKVKLLKNGFTIEKYGSAPANFGKEPKEVIREVEVIKEVEVEKIIEKEVIREVPVEKEVYITDDTKTNELVAKISELESLLQKSEGNIHNLKEEFKLAAKLHNEELSANLNGVLGEKQKMKEEYEAKIKDLEEQLKKKNNKPDIYGGATFGSNLMD